MFLNFYYCFIVTCGETYWTLSNFDLVGSDSRRAFLSILAFGIHNFQILRESHSSMQFFLQKIVLILPPLLLRLFTRSETNWTKGICHFLEMTMGYGRWTMDDESWWTNPIDSIFSLHVIQNCTCDSTFHLPSYIHLSASTEQNKEDYLDRTRLKKFSSNLNSEAIEFCSWNKWFCFTFSIGRQMYHE